MKLTIVLMACMSSLRDKRFGERSEIRLLKHYMKLRAKEICARNSLGKSVGGKGKKEICRQERLSIHKPLPEGSVFPIAEMLPSAAFDPFGLTIVNQFSDALPPLEADVAEQMIAGYTQRETLQNLGITMEVFRDARQALKEKALEYLV